MITKKATAKAVKKKEVKKEGVTTPEIETPIIPEEIQTPEENEPKEVKKSTDVIGSLRGWKQVHQKINTVRVQALRGPLSHRGLPEDVQKWLKNKWYWTNIYQKPKEWLEAHKVDMTMVEKLKKFINDKYL